MSESKCLLEKVLGIMQEDGVQSKLPQSAVFLTLVMTEVHEVLDVIVGSDVLNVLRQTVKQRG